MNSEYENIYSSEVNHYKILEKIKNCEDLDSFFLKLNKYLKKTYEVENLLIKIQYKEEKDKLLEGFFENSKESNFNFIVQTHKKSIIIYSLRTNTLLRKSLEDFLTKVSSILLRTYLEYKIDELKLQDPVTSLYNREYLSLYLSKMLPLSKRENKKIAFLLLGIDHFKAVIDEFNYDIGDKLLINCSMLLNRIVRTSDLVIKLDKDEFLLVLPNIINESNAIMIANKLIKSFASLDIEVNKETKQVLRKTISVGISLYPDDSVTIDEILRNADVSLYEAKNIGRSSLYKYSKEDSSSINLF